MPTPSLPTRTIISVCDMEEEEEDLTMSPGFHVNMDDEECTTPHHKRRGAHKSWVPAPCIIIIIIIHGEGEGRGVEGDNTHPNDKPLYKLGSTYGDVMREKG